MELFPLTHVPRWLLLLSNTISYADEFGVIVPLLVGLRRRPALAPAMRIIVLYHAFWTLQAPLNLWSRKVLHTNVYLHHLDVLVETWLLGWAYYRALPTSRLRRWIPGLLGVFTLVALGDFAVHGLHEFNTYSRVAQTILMIGLILWYFEHWLRRAAVRASRFDGMFLVNVGLTVYFAGSIGSYVFLGFIKAESLQRLAAVIIGLMDLACLALATLGLWYDQTQLSGPRFIAWARQPRLLQREPVE